MKAIQNSKILGQLIRDERKAQHLTQAQLAALTGVGIRFVRELELGKESCRIGLVFQVMNMLGLTFTVHTRAQGTP